MAGGKRGGQGGRGAKSSSHRKGAPQGSGGKRRKALEGKGPTPPAEDRYGHPAAKQGTTRHGTPPGRSGGPKQGKPGKQGPSGSRGGPGGAAGGPETVAGRNPVLEALRAGVPASVLHVADRIERDDRVTESLKLAAEAGIPLQDTSRPELDRLTRGGSHQGLALRVRPYDYAHPDELLAHARDSGEPPLLVALDRLTDPHNLGAIARSTAALGGHGILLPERRAAGVTAGAWKASAGALARVPVARAANLNRTVAAYRSEGLFVVGLSGSGEVPLASLELATEPLVVVVGSESAGLSRLLAETCDLHVHVPMVSGTESLNASVAAGIALYEIARRRSA